MKNQKPQNKWRSEHEEFMESMKYMKKMKAVIDNGGNLRSLGPPPESKIV